MIFKITGQVREIERKIGVPNLVVRAFDKDLIYDDLLGSVTTDENGCFEIIYEETDYRELFDKQPDIYLTIKSPDYSRVLHTTEEKVRFEADKEEHFIIDIPRKILGDLAPPIGGNTMGLAKLNIWITEKGDPCRISNETWRVSIAHCDGRVLEWCGKRYAHLEAKCGHLEISVPPGCYVIRAAMWSWDVDKGILIRGNYVTERAIARVGCGETACVTLVTPSAYTCAYFFDLVLRIFQQKAALPIEKVQTARQAIEVLLPHLPQTAFDIAEAEFAEELFEKGGGCANQQEEQSEDSD